MAIAVLRDVHGIMHPALLVGDGLQWTAQGTAAREMRAASAAVYPVDHDHLDRLIDEALVPLFGHVPRRDLRRIFPRSAGSTTVFIRTNEHSPMIWLFAEIELEIDDWELLLRAVNGLNHDSQLIKFTASAGDGDRQRGTRGVAVRREALDLRAVAHVRGRRGDHVGRAHG